MKNQIDLSKFKTVFCDDYNALMWAYDNNLSRNAIVKTYSPKIYYSNLKNIRKMNNEISKTQNIKLIDLYKNYLKETKDILINNFSNELTFYLIQKIFIFKRVIEKVIDLNIDDLKGEILFIKIIGDSGPDTELYLDDGNILNPPWEQIFKNFKNFTIIEYEVKNFIKNKDRSKNKTSFIKRIHFAGMDAFLYRIILKFKNFIPKIFFSKNILIASENELLIETSYQMFLKGYLIDFIKQPDQFIPTKDLNSEIIKSNKNIINKMINEINNKHFINFIDKNFINNTKELLILHLAKSMLIYEKKKIYFENILKKINKKTIIFSGSSFSGNGNGAALLSVSKKFNIPFVVFQHGVGTEIEQFGNGTLLPHESTLSSVYVAFNKASKIIADKYNEPNNNIISGISSRHLRIKKKLKSKKKSIIYISTFLPKGNYNQDSSFYKDIDTIKIEFELINNVFAKLDCDFLYKTYPQTNMRYMDGDPIIDELHKHKIKFYDGKIDMRYMIEKYNIFITTDATSTLTWPLLSNKPLIFINSLKKPIDEKLKNIFKESLFYFEEDDSELFKNINNILNMSMDKIFNLYNKKSNKRKDLIKKYFSEYLSNSGSRTSEELLGLNF